MNKDEIKVLLKFAKFFMVTVLCFWIAETLVFLMVEGWHIKATNPIEIYLDKCFINGFNCSLTIFLFCGIDYLYNFIFNK